MLKHFYHEKGNSSWFCIYCELCRIWEYVYNWSHVSRAWVSIQCKKTDIFMTPFPYLRKRFVHLTRGITDNYLEGHLCEHTRKFQENWWVAFIVLMERTASLFDDKSSSLICVPLKILKQHLEKYIRKSRLTYSNSRFFWESLHEHVSNLMKIKWLKIHELRFYWQKA